MAVAGLAAIIGGAVIRELGRRQLGEAYSPFLRTSSGQRLATGGIYRHIRHPIYTGTVLANLGLPLLFGSLSGFLVMLLILPLVFYRIHIEEKMLSRRFGADFTAYRRRTKRFIPGVF